MKKKCTNSKCRKVFSIMEDGTSRCPYCYKRYNRIVRKEKHPVIRIKNDNFSEYRVAVGLRYATGMPFDDCREMAKSKKLILGDFTPVFLWSSQNHGYNSPMKYLLHIIREDGKAVIQY